CQQHNSFPRTF
nr:immunoglobulin light chain junction region [Macaca mulatta]MOW39268.1 immunoglobulin light chain junction region [Macaca mulatta]MOW39284.1 immunoglobulin light chain junction region [Macaca mulatta]MOW39296.1 immunoglobulin light chain junction region [Macaca mulatta]MOW39424.1 immunoglobulin light chain junction region [Macaca mulatta]